MIKLSQTEIFHPKKKQRNQTNFKNHFNELRLSHSTIETFCCFLTSKLRVKTTLMLNFCWFHQWSKFKKNGNLLKGRSDVLMLTSCFQNSEIQLNSDFFLNLDDWWNHQKFNNCLVLTRDFEVKKQQKVSIVEWLNLNSLKWFWKFVWFLCFFLG